MNRAILANLLKILTDEEGLDNVWLQYDIENFIGLYNNKRGLAINLDIECRISDDNLYTSIDGLSLVPFYIKDLCKDWNGEEDGLSYMTSTGYLFTSNMRGEVYYTYVREISRALVDYDRGAKISLTKFSNGILKSSSSFS